MAVRMLAAAVAIACLSSMAAAETPASGAGVCAGTYEAEIVVSKYSGLPNPHFVLRGEDARSLWELLRRPRALGWPYPIPTDVGLGGYYVTFVCPVRKETRVMGEILYTSEAEGGSFYDPDREVYRYLTERFHAQPPAHPWQRAPRAP